MESETESAKAVVGFSALPPVTLNDHPCRHLARERGEMFWIQ